MPPNRNRVIYAGNTVLISDYPSWNSQTGDYSLKLLNRIQTSAISIDSPIVRPKQIGSSDFAFDKYINYPTVKVDLSYYLTDNSNELLLGFNATGNEGILKNLSPSERDRNLFFVFSDQNEDVNTLTNYTGRDVIGIGNAFITNYSISADVNNIPSANISFDCLNIVYQNYTGYSTTSGPSGPRVLKGTEIPAIKLSNGIKSTGSYLLAPANFTTSNYLTNQNLKASALTSADIVLEIEQPLLGGIRYSGSVYASISSLQIDIPIERKDLLGFGSNYPYDKKLIFPIVGTVSFDGTFDNQVTGQLNTLFDDANEYAMTFYFKDCEQANQLRIDLLYAKVENQSFNLSIGENMNFSSSFSFRISETDGFRVSGAARLTDSLYQPDNYS
jgi:hypothetical protein